MNAAADLDGIFIVPDVTARAFVPKYAYVRYRTLGDRLDIDHKKPASLLTFIELQSCFENVDTRRSRDRVWANSRFIPRLEKVITFRIRNLHQNISGMLIS